MKRFAMVQRDPAGRPWMICRYDRRAAWYQLSLRGPDGGHQGGGSRNHQIVKFPYQTPMDRIPTGYGGIIPKPIRAWSRGPTTDHPRGYPSEATTRGRSEFRPSRTEESATGGTSVKPLRATREAPLTVTESAESL